MFIDKSYVTGIDTDGFSLDNLKLFQVQLEVIIEGFKKNNWVIPEYLNEKLRALKVEIEVREKEEKLRQIKLLQARIETYTPREERRAKAQQELEALKKDLGIV